MISLDLNLEPSSRPPSTSLCFPSLLISPLWASFSSSVEYQEELCTPTPHAQFQDCTHARHSTSTILSSQKSSLTDLTLLMSGKLRWTPEQWRQMKIPSL